MPIDKGGEQDRARPETDWDRIETERAQRDAVRRKYDELHDPSPEFEKAARPLSPEYGSHRPKHLDLSPEQIAEIEGFTGKSIEDVLKTREKDPRAGHNRDEHGRILDAHGNPKEVADPSGVPQEGTDKAPSSSPPTGDANAQETSEGAIVWGGAEARSDEGEAASKRAELGERQRGSLGGEVPDRVRDLPPAHEVLPNIHSAEVPAAKLHAYSLNPDHKDNRGKANGWRAIGYDVESSEARQRHAEELTTLINDGLQDGGSRVTKTSESDYGMRYRVETPIVGPNGRSATLLTGWRIVDDGDQQHPRLNTVWVKPHKEAEA